MYLNKIIILWIKKKYIYVYIYIYIYIYTKIENGYISSWKLQKQSVTGIMLRQFHVQS